MKLRYRIKKFRRKDFPFLKGPATDTTAIGLSLTSWRWSNFIKFSFSSSTAPSPFTLTTWRGSPFKVTGTAKFKTGSEYYGYETHFSFMFYPSPAPVSWINTIMLRSSIQQLNWCSSIFSFWSKSSRHKQVSVFIDFQKAFDSVWLKPDSRGFCLDYMKRNSVPTIGVMCT